MKYVKTFESLNTQKQLEKLSYDILKVSSDNMKNNELCDVYIRDIDISKYDIDIQEMLKTNLVGVVFQQKKDNKAGTYFNNLYIFLYYDKSFMEYDIDFSKLYYTFYSTLLHELQHVYDSYISKGKYNSKKHSNFDEYLNLNPEINARFTQAISKIKFYKSEIKNNEIIKTKNKFEDVLNDFKLKYSFWNDIQEKYKLRLIKRLWNYWNSI